MKFLMVLLFISSLCLADDFFENGKGAILSFTFGMTEVAPQMCRPTDKTHAESFVNFKDAWSDFRNKNFPRIKLRQERRSFLKARINELTKHQNHNLQVSALNFQKENIALELDSLRGTSFYTMDKKQAEAKETAIIPALENLALKILATIEKGQQEHNEMSLSYEALLTGIQESSDIAEKACQNKAVTEECFECAGGGFQNFLCRMNEGYVQKGYGQGTYDITESEQGRNLLMCKNKETDAPIVGSCEMKKLLEEYRKSIVADYWKVYSSEQHSVRLNLQMKELENLMHKTVTEFPKSQDPKYDWTTPLLRYLKMEDTRAKFGLNCVAGDINAQDENSIKLFNMSHSFISILNVNQAHSEKLARLIIANLNTSDKFVGQAAKRIELYSFALKEVKERIKNKNIRADELMNDYKKLSSIIPVYANQTEEGDGEGITPGCSTNCNPIDGQGIITPNTSYVGATGAVVTHKSTGNSAVANPIVRPHLQENTLTNQNTPEIPKGSVSIQSAGEAIVVGPLSSGNLAIAEGLNKKIKANEQAQSIVGKSIQSKSTGPSLLNENSASGLRRLEELYLSNQGQHFSADDLKIYSNPQSTTSLDKNLDTPAAEVSSKQKVIYFQNNPQANETSEEKVASVSKNEELSSGSVTHRKARPSIELFDNISDAYKKAGRNRLGLPEDEVTNNKD